MKVIYLLSVLLFVLLVTVILVRSAMLGRRGIKSIVFGEDKRDFLLVPFVLLIAYIVVAVAFELPIWEVAVRPFWQLAWLAVVGVVVCTLSLVGAVATLNSFGDSFRVGIDEQKPDKLVTTGMFAISRNPIYLCFLAFMVGQFLIHPNVVLLVSWGLFAMAIHRRVMREERFLVKHYGEEYVAYFEKVRRYF